MSRMNRISSAVAATALLAVAATGCNNSDITSINNNPNAPTNAPLPAVFLNGVQSGVSNWLGAGYDLRDISLLIQDFAENQYIGNDQYKGVGPGAQNNLFSSVYQNSLEDLQVVVRQ